MQNKSIEAKDMWSIICFLLILAIVVMAAGVVLFIAWQIVRFVLNLVCYLLFGQDEIF